MERASASIESTAPATGCQYALPEVALEKLAEALRTGGVSVRIVLPASVDKEGSAAREAAGGRRCSLSDAAGGAAGAEGPVRADRPAAVRGMTVDSREVVPGNLFVCKGAAFKPGYLERAVAAGAAAYLCQEDADAPGAIPTALAAAAPGAPCLVTDDVRRAMALAAPAVYGHPERELAIVGITGTKGKSTTAYLLRAILAAAGREPSILGSIGTDDGLEHFESRNTTPEAPELWRHLRNTRVAGRSTMVMEVSSQGLKYDRVAGVPFEIGVFLNIGRDHISPIEHPTFEDYFASKLKLFAQTETAVVSLDTERADEVLAAARTARRLVTISAAGDPAADLFACNVAPGATGISFDACHGGAVGPHAAGSPVRQHIELAVPGVFNVENALAAIACARLLGASPEAVAQGLIRARVPGRMEVVSSPDGHVIALIDYAHNELSYRALFDSVERSYPGRRIVAVFGAPGDKAQERRAVLPAIAGAHADHLIYTEEDPGHESVEAICAELAAHTPAGVSYEVICDREQAVCHALRRASEDAPDSVVLLLAKGDETRQHRGDAYEAVESDLALARRMLRG